MIRRTSWPSLRRAAACSSACSTTAPQNDHEKGTTIPTFTPAESMVRGTMNLEGIHHVTLITGDAPRNVDFYTRVLGLRLVKKTVNQDDPTVYHLFYADERGSAGRRHHVLRVPGRAPRPRRRGDGAHDHLAGRVRGGARLLGGAARRRGRRDRPRRTAGCASTTPRARARARGRRDAGRAARRRASGDPGGARAAGLRRRARVRARPGAQPAAARGGARLRAARRERVGGARRAARRLLRLRPAARRARHRRRRHGPPRRVGLDDGGARGVARARRRRRARSRRR